MSKQPKPLATMLPSISETRRKMAAYFEACLEEANGRCAAFIAKALGDIARVKGMAQVARDAGSVPRKSYKALSGERTPLSTPSLKSFGRWG